MRGCFPCSLSSLAREKTSGGWRDGSSVKGTGCFSKEPGLDSRQPQGGSGPPVTLVMRNPIPFSVLWGAPGTCVVYRHMCRQSMHVHKIKVKVF